MAVTSNTKIGDSREVKVFLCYRRSDGSWHAEWLYDLLNGIAYEDANRVPCKIVAYYDVTAPGVANWKELHFPSLQTSEALIFICTPGTAVDFTKKGQPDWVYKEIKWWTRHRKTASIVVDATGEGERWMPELLRRKWPDVNRIPLIKEEAEDPGIKHRIRERILGAIRESERATVFEDLEKSKKLNKRLKIFSFLSLTLLMLALIASVLATNQWQKASRGKIQAQANALSAHAQLALIQDPTLALNLAIAACRKNQSRETLPVLAGILSSTHMFYHVTFVGHDLGVTSVAFAPDGKYVLTGSEDASARLWTLEGQEIQSFEGHNESITAVAFSPDGRHLLTGSEDASGMLWMLENNKGKPFRGHSGSVTSVAFSPDGKHLVTGSKDASVIQWTLEGRKEKSFSVSSIVRALAFSPDGQQILTGSNEARLLTLEGEEDKHFPIDGYVLSVAFSPDGRHFLTGGTGDPMIVAVHGEDQKSLPGHNGTVTSVAFSPDGKHVLTGSRDRSAKIWTREGNPLQSFVGHSAGITSVAFSPDGIYILTGSQDTTARLWKLSGLEIQSFDGHNSQVTAVAISPDGKYVLSGSEDGSVNLWTREGEKVRSFQGHSQKVASVAFSPDGNAFLTGSRDGSAILWTLEGKEKKALLQKPPKTDPKEYTREIPLDVSVHSVKFSPDGRYIMTGVWSNKIDGRVIRLWTIEGEEVQSLPYHGDAAIATFSTDSRYVLIAGKSSAALWAITGRKVKYFSGQGAAVISVAFSPDGKYILTGLDDGSARIWTLKGKEIRTINANGNPVSSVSFSPDGQYILSASEKDKSAKLWTLDGLEVQSFPGYHGGITFSPDGRSVLIGSEDNTAKLLPRWDYIQEFGLIAPLTEGQKARYGIE